MAHAATLASSSTLRMSSSHSHPESLRVVPTAVPSSEPPVSRPVVTKRKRVTWPPDDIQLNQVRLFSSEEAPIMAGSLHHHQAQSQGQAWRPHSRPAHDAPPGFAPQQGRHRNKRVRYDSRAVDAMTVQFSWAIPRNISPDAEWGVSSGDESLQLAEQQQREKSTFEAFYPRISAIPDSPIEPSELPDDTEEDSIARIPLHPVEDEQAEPSDQPAAAPASKSPASEPKVSGPQGTAPVSPRPSVAPAQAGTVQLPPRTLLAPSAGQSSGGAPAHGGRAAPGAMGPPQDTAALRGSGSAAAPPAQPASQAPPAPSHAVASASPEIAAAAAAAVASLSESGKVDEGLLAKTIAALTAKQQAQAPVHFTKAPPLHAGVQPRPGPMHGVGGMGPPQAPQGPRQVQQPQVGMQRPPLHPHRTQSQLSNGPHVSAPYPDGPGYPTPGNLGLRPAGAGMGDSSGGNSSHGTETLSHRPPQPQAPMEHGGSRVPSSQGPRPMQAPPGSGTAQLPAPPRAPGDQAQVPAREPPPHWHHGPQPSYGGPGGAGSGLQAGPPPLGAQNFMGPMHRGPPPRGGAPFNPDAPVAMAGAPPFQFQDSRGGMPRGPGGPRPGGMRGPPQPDGMGPPQGSWMPPQAHEMRPRGMMPFRGPPQSGPGHGPGPGAGPGAGPGRGFPPHPHQHPMGAPSHHMAQGPGPMRPPERLGPGGPGGNPGQARGGGPPGQFGPHPGWPNAPPHHLQQQRPPGNAGGAFRPAAGPQGPLRPHGEGPIRPHGEGPMRPAVPPNQGPRGPLPGAPKIQWVTRVEGTPVGGPEALANGQEKRE